MFVNRGEGGGKYTVRYPSFFHERGLRWFCHCWVHDFSAYIPFLRLEIVLHQEESEENTKNHKNSSYADGEEELGKCCWSGPRCWREATAAPDLSGTADMFTQAGRKMERSGRRTGEGVCHGEPQTQWSTESAIIAHRGNRPMSPQINSPPSGFLLNRILLQFLWFPFILLSLSQKKKKKVSNNS